MRALHFARWVHQYLFYDHMYIVVMYKLVLQNNFKLHWKIAMARPVKCYNNIVIIIAYLQMTNVILKDYIRHLFCIYIKGREIGTSDKILDVIVACLLSASWQKPAGISYLTNSSTYIIKGCQAYSLLQRREGTGASFLY